MEEVGEGRGKEERGKGGKCSAKGIYQHRAQVRMDGRPSCLGTEPVCCWPDSHPSFLCLGTRLGLCGGLSDPSWNRRAAGPRAISLAFVISSLAGS